MQPQAIQSKYYNNLSILFILICVFVILIPEIGIIGKILFWGIAFLNLIPKLIKWRIQNWSPLIVLLTGWMLIRSQNFLGLSYFAMFFLLMIFYISDIRFTRPNKFGSLIFFISFLIVSIIVRLTSDFFSNKNIGALFMTMLTFITYTSYGNKNKWILVIGFCATLVYDSRSIFLALLLAGVIMYLVKKCNIAIGKILLLFMATIIITIIYFWDFLWSEEFNSMIFEYTNKNFQSGRQLIWGAIFDKMCGIDWIIGKGGGVDHRLIVPVHYANMSLHSAYVFMLFHYGVVGLFLLWGLLYGVIKKLVYNKAYLSATLFLFFALRDFFEITIINNQMAIAFLFWVWIGNGWLDNVSHPLESVCHLKNKKSNIKHNYSIV